MRLSAAQTATVVLIASATLVVGAFAFQYIGGLAPCVLCWWQRYAHFATIALAVLALLAARGSSRAGWALVVLAAAALLIGAGIAAFHVGVEQHWWQGTAECGSSTAGASSIDELRARLLNQPIVRCDEVAWSLFGISMAGYNFLISLALAAFALIAGVTHLRGRTW